MKVSQWKLSNIVRRSSNSLSSNTDHTVRRDWRRENGLLVNIPIKRRENGIFISKKLSHRDIKSPKWFSNDFLASAFSSKSLDGLLSSFLSNLLSDLEPCVSQRELSRRTLHKVYRRFAAALCHRHKATVKCSQCPNSTGKLAIVNLLLESLPLESKRTIHPARQWDLIKIAVLNNSIVSRSL